MEDEASGFAGHTRWLGSHSPVILQNHCPPWASCPHTLRPRKGMPVNL
jgi:hypothetical protein